MEVAIGSSSGPFQREVREWQHVDPNTGALLSGRIEADRWIDGPLNKYGKVIDSKNISTPNGIQHSQRKQLEILKAHTASGSSLQVVRAQTVQTSSSRWSTTSSSSGSKTGSFLHPDPSKSIEYYNNNNSTNSYSDNSYKSSAANNYMNNIATNPHMASNNNNNNSVSNNNFTSMFQPQQHQTTQDQNNVLSQQLHDVNMNTTATELQHILRPTDISTISDVGVVVRRKPATTMLSMSTVPQNHSYELNEREILLNNNSNNSNNNYSSHSGNLSRGKSVSNEDITIENPDINLDENGEPIEWKRVSKIRRSLQYPKSSTSVNQRQSYSRPPDLPPNSVSVQRIKQELENGRRLSTVMRNNHIDLAALESILNGDNLKTDSKSVSPTISSSSSSSTSDQRTSFITAESLKEIRGRLRKLSDESLYRDDMSHIEHKLESRKSGLVDRSAIKIAEPTVKEDSEMVNTNGGSVTSSRSKYKNLSSTNDWYLRRKSYGFEKMLPQSDSSSKMLESTDSGIGRSSEISNWSANESAVKGTVVALNELNTAKKNNSSSMSITFTNGSHDIKHSNSRQMMNLLSNGNFEDEIKRHSIAVDEAKYVRDNLRRVFESKTSIHLNGMYSDDSSSQTNNSDDNRDSRKNAKRVEFCKTEVHFAAESGRVNIVETDGKPPPTNNFRRRRRISSGSSNISASYLEAINSGVPVTHFGDTEKKATPATILERATKQPTSDVAAITTAVTEISSTIASTTTTSSLASATREYDENADHDDDNTSIRGILKNKPIKPRPYHLGDNIENSESLWGVRLRPVSNDFTNWRSSICNNDETNEISTSPSMSSPPSSSSSSSLNKQQNINNLNNNNSNNSSNNNNSSNVNNDRDKTTNSSITNQPNESTSMNLGYSTKVNLSSNPSSFAWNNKDQPSHQQSHDNPKITVKLRGNDKKTSQQDDKETTKICIDMSTSASSSPTDLKSTSLIMQTIRSSGHFDDLMKNLEYGTDKLNRLSICDPDNKSNKSNGPSQPTSALKLISQMNAITKSSSANSLLKDTSKLSLYDQNSYARGKKYSSSLDGGDYNRNDYDSELDNMDSTRLYVARKHSLQNKIEENYKIISNYSNSSFSSCSEKYDYGTIEYGDDDDIKRPIAAPRMKKIGPANVLSQQLSQLRRLYEAADQDDSDDSAKADEEVKHYLGNLISMEERTSELSGSWSRVKAKRSVMKKEEIKNMESGKEKASEYKYSNGHKDLIHSNVMSIALHSPTASQKRSTSPIPIAKPRSVVAPATTKTMITSTTTTVAAPTATKQQHHQTVVRKLNPNEKDGDRNSLKLASGGPRKLREHELSYFGVSVPKSASSSSLPHQPKQQTISPNNTNINHKSLTTATTVLSGSKNLSTAKLNNTNSSNNDNFLKKWQLTHDKPDLLRHSPNNNPGDYTNIKSSSSTSSLLTTTSSSSLVKMNTKTVDASSHAKKLQKTSLGDEPVYENIRKINSYERKHDLKRDEMILSELSKTADQILSSISGYTDDDSNEENKRISANHKKATNLHTIDEHKSISQKTMHSKGVQVSTPVYTGNSTSLRRKSKTSPDSRHHSHHHQQHQHHRRVSSASSNESLPRGISATAATTTIQKTKRLCHKHHESQSADLRSGSSMNSVKSVTRRKASDRMHRTSSRDTLNSNNASSSEDLQSSVEIPRRPRRIRTKDKSESQQIVKKSETKSSTLRSGSADKTSTSHRNTIRSTTSSHRNDHGPVIKDNKGSILIEQQQKHRIKSGVVTTTPSSATATAATTTTSSKRGTIRSLEKVWK